MRIAGTSRGVLKAPKRLLFDLARRTGELPVDALIAALRERLARLTVAGARRRPPRFRRKLRRGTYKIDRVF